MTTADPHHLTGAYALHALSDEEAVVFERHLAGCEACARETAELSATAARLGLAATVSPPAALRERVLRRIGSVRQQSPGGAAAGRPGRARLRGRPLYRWALAACLAAAAALGGTAVWQHERAEDALSQAREAERTRQEIAAVLASPDARTRAAVLGDGSTGAVVVSRSRDEAVFVVSNMPHPPSGKVYQLWFNDDGRMRSAGLMDPGRSDQAVLLRGSLRDASGMGVTVEPSGGSEEPTSEPVALLPFPT
ncbi:MULTISPECIES: anti-sigma factor [unclassified Streptomyces]|uniref:anti-sigma factor n=1 Tax=unclassified Streptomyces TaxID=2593676 RepID=UPI003D7338CE